MFSAAQFPSPVAHSLEVGEVGEEVGEVVGEEVGEVVGEEVVRALWLTAQQAYGR